METGILINVFYFSWLGINTFILTPIIIHYVIQFWKLNNNINSFDKRFPNYTIALVIAAVFHGIIIRTIADLPRFMNFKYSVYIRLTLYNTLHIIYIMNLIRGWLLYVEYIRGLQLSALAWQQQIIDIDSNIHYKLPWTIRYKWVNNPKLLTLIGTIYWIILVVTINISYWFHQNYSDYSQTLFYFIFVILCVILAFKVRKCRDKMFIHAELRWMGLIFIIAVPLLFVCLVMFMSQMLALTVNVLVNGCIFIIAMINTKYVVHKYKQLSNYSLEDDLYDHGDLRPKYDVKLVTILENKDGFDMFSEHLVKEFSIEHLLFLFEIMQLKQEMLQKKLLIINNEQVDIGVNYKIGQFYMKTVKRNDGVINAKKIYERYALLLWNYIVSDGEYSINISAKLRTKILNDSSDVMMEYQYMMRSDTMAIHHENMMNIKVHRKQKIANRSTEMDALDEEIENKINMEDQIRIVKYLKLLDEAVEDVLRLLSSDSYHRFCQTSDFKKLIESNPNLIVQNTGQ